MKIFCRSQIFISALSFTLCLSAEALGAELCKRFLKAPSISIDVESEFPAFIGAQILTSYDSQTGNYVSSYGKDNYIHGNFTTVESRFSMLQGLSAQSIGRNHEGLLIQGPGDNFIDGSIANFRIVKGNIELQLSKVSKNQKLLRSNWMELDVPDSLYGAKLWGIDVVRQSIRVYLYSFQNGKYDIHRVYYSIRADRLNSLSEIEFAHPKYQPFVENMTDRVLDGSRYAFERLETVEQQRREGRSHFPYSESIKNIRMLTVVDGKFVWEPL